MFAECFKVKTCFSVIVVGHGRGNMGSFCSIASEDEHDFMVYGDSLRDFSIQFGL